MTLTPAQELIVRTHATLHEAWRDDRLHLVDTTDGDPYTPVDYEVSRRLGVTVEAVGSALVDAGKRPPVWWIG